jgi:hypothetical protein
MNALKNKWGLSVAALLAAASVWACTATRNGDGSITITFAPDMVIRAFGLEDALEKLIDLKRQCLAGTFSRPCTLEEMREIKESIANVLDAKSNIRTPRPKPG